MPNLLQHGRLGTCAGWNAARRGAVRFGSFLAMLVIVSNHVSAAPAKRTPQNRTSASLLLQRPPSLPESKTPDDKKLSERLLRKVTDESAGDLMARITRLMSETAHRIEIEFDAGDETQRLQRRIVDGLEEAIKVAAARRRAVRSRRPSGTGDKRRRSGAHARTREGSAKAQQQGTGSSGSRAKPDAASESRSPSGRLLDMRRTWGHLPMRTREEIIQGVGEQSLERFRVWIERYYRALQESPE